MATTIMAGIELAMKDSISDGQMLGKSMMEQSLCTAATDSQISQFLTTEQVALPDFLEDQSDEGYATSPAASSPGSIWSTVPSPSSVDEDTISSIASLWDEVSNDSTLFRPSLKRTAAEASMGNTSPKFQKLAQASDSSLLQGRVPSSDFTSALRHSQLLLHLSGTPTEDPLLPPISKSPVQSNNESSKTISKKTVRPKSRKAPGLSVALPSSHGDVELVISDQPERHHRARYIIEGSRGCVKNESKVGFPAVQLRGINRPVELQVFIITDQGKVRPHGYYQACKVTGQHATPCTEVDMDCTKVIKIPWQPAEDGGVMELRIDCVGILKLRNADVEHNGGLYRSKKKSTSVRMAFRVALPDSNVIIQTISSLVCCTQPLGHPEIIKKSLTQCSAAGGDELFIIGKNFITKNCEVNLLELSGAGKTVWSGACEIDKSLFHKTHIVCRIPPYHANDIQRPVEVFLVVTSGGGKSSELMAHPITYTPIPGMLLFAMSTLHLNSSLKMLAVRSSSQSPVTVHSVPVQTKCQHQPSQLGFLCRSVTSLDQSLNGPIVIAVQLSAVTYLEESIVGSPRKLTLGDTTESNKLKPEVAPVQEPRTPDLSNAAVLQLLASRLTCTKDSSPPILSINDQIPLVSMGQPLDPMRTQAEIASQQTLALQQQIIQQTQKQSFEDLMRVAAGLMTKHTVVQPAQPIQDQALGMTAPPPQSLTNLSLPGVAIQQLSPASLQQQQQNDLSEFVSSSNTLSAVPALPNLQTNATTLPASEPMVLNAGPHQLSIPNLVEAFSNSQMDITLNPNSQVTAPLNDVQNVNLQVVPAGQLTGVAVEDVLDLLKMMQQKPATLFT